MSKLLLMAALLFSMNAMAGTSIDLKGTVKKEGNVAIAGARVSLKQYPAIVALTDANGAFALSGNNAQNKQSDSVVVVAKGFRSALEPITSYAKSDIAVTLTASNPWAPSGPLEHMRGMVKIRAKGYDFEMGQPCDTIRGTIAGFPTTDGEQPVHTVSFTYDFWMDTVEVTQGEYDSLMKMTYGSKYSKPSWNASNGIGLNWAAYAIEWGSAALFCNARSKSQGLPDTAYSYTGITGRVGALCTLQNVSVKLHANAYRLPTEAEWEYACRGGTFSDYYWGKDYEDYRVAPVKAEIDSYSTWLENSFSLGKDAVIRLGPGLDSLYYGAHEVGKKKPNRYGLYDMAGNLSEWCNDWDDYYAWGAAIDPTGPVPATPTGYIQVRRGGNWSNGVSYLRSTERGFDYFDYPYWYIGFRVVSSGITSSVKKTGSMQRGRAPTIRLYSGVICFDNAAGGEIGIYSLYGKKVFSAIPQSRRFLYETKALSPGSYIVRIPSKSGMSRVINICR
jgi:formylglycine-generating enzyme required for sulfatase activity